MAAPVVDGDKASYGIAIAAPKFRMPAQNTAAITETVVAAAAAVTKIWLRWISVPCVRVRVLFVLKWLWMPMGPTCRLGWHGRESAVIVPPTAGPHGGWFGGDGWKLLPRLGIVFMSPARLVSYGLAPWHLDRVGVRLHLRRAFSRSESPSEERDPLP